MNNLSQRNVNLYSAYLQTHLTRSCMTQVIKGSHSCTCTHHDHLLTKWNIRAFAFQLKLVLIYQKLSDERQSRLGQPEQWLNSQPRSVTQYFSRLLIANRQRHSRLTGQTGVSGLPEANTWPLQQGMRTNNLWVEHPTSIELYMLEI